MQPLSYALNIYTDGSSLAGPRCGGVGYRFVVVEPDGEEITEDSDLAGHKGGSNNQMELMACVLALEEASLKELPSHVTKVVVFTDSMYVYNNYNMAIYTWPGQRWLSKHGKPILNVDYWKRLVRAINKVSRRQSLGVEFRWVKGHSKCNHNKAADKLAKASAKQPLHGPNRHVNLRRRRTKNATKVGCVGMHGQRLTIRIVGSEYLQHQRVWKYRYEVISRNSRYFGGIDFIYQDREQTLLRDGREYHVRVSSDENNPRITKVYREVGKKADDPHISLPSRIRT